MKKTLLFIGLLTLFYSSTLLLSGSVSAVCTPDEVAAGTCIDITDNLDPNYIKLPDIKPSSYVVVGTNILLMLSGIASFFYLLWGGIQWITSGGDKEGLEKARKKITAALIGLAITFSAFALLFIISALFGGTSLLEFKIPSLI